MFLMYSQIMRIKLFTLLLIAVPVLAFGQTAQKVEWSTLMDITFKDIYVEKDDIYVYYPLFGQAQNELDGKQIEITGYIIPIDVEANLYVLSAFPFSACFFCGNAGPESVMAINFKGNNRRFDTDERLTLQGTLQLNSTDVDELVYVLNDAVAKN